MPKILPRPCRKAGCRQRTRNQTGFCDQHREEAPRRDYKTEYCRRQKRFNFLYNRRWRQARQVFLTANPLCAICWQHNLYQSAVIVDHIIPHRGSLTRFWDQSNWQALCKRCHDAKTAHEDRRDKNRC